MRNIVERLLRRPFVRQFIKFSLVGVGNFAIDFGGYFLLTRIFAFHYLYANATSWLVAVCFSFTMNKFWTFRAHAPASLFGQYSRFFMVSVGSLLLSTLFLHFFIESFGWPDLFSKLATIAVVVMWNFTLNKFWTFKA